MPNYPVTLPQNGINQGLFPFHVNKEFFKEWVQITPFWNLMGNEMTRPIVRHQMRDGEGWQYSMGKLETLNYLNPVLDFNQVSGQAQTQAVSAASVTCSKISFPVIIKGPDLLEAGTPIDLPAAVRPQLIEASQRYLNKNLMDTAMFNYVANGPAGGYLPATQKPSYDRLVVAGANAGGTNAANVADRTAYNQMAGITTSLNAMNGGIAYNQNGLSAAHLLRLKRYATQGGASGTGAVMPAGSGTAIEDPIRPAYMKSRGGWPMNDYIYLCSSLTIQQLYSDPMFFQSTAARGTVIDSSDQPQTIYGSEYHGKFFGIHIYEIKDLANYTLTSQNGNYTVAWELFIGAGAWSLGWYKEPWIAFDNNQIDSFQLYTTHEIRGQTALKFAANQTATVAAGIPTVEQGIIHSFVRIA